MVEKSHTTGSRPSLYEPLRNAGARLAEWVAPASEAATTDDAYRINIELPGVAEEDIDVSVHDGMVTLKGEKKLEREEKGETWYFSEREYGTFSRSFRLPPDADGNKVVATLKDGVLMLAIPKLNPSKAKSSKVKIQRG